MKKHPRDICGKLIQPGDWAQRVNESTWFASEGDVYRVENTSNTGWFTLRELPEERYLGVSFLRWWP